jgi:hypothetical protein
MGHVDARDGLAACAVPMLVRLRVSLAIGSDRRQGLCGTRSLR